MRGKFGLSRCCCDCITCPYCLGGEASRQFWLHIDLVNGPQYSGNYLLTNTGACFWETDESELPVRAFLQIDGTKAVVQVSNDDTPGIVARWEYEWQLPDLQADCQDWSQVPWTCKEDTGTLACDPGDTFELQPVFFPDVVDDVDDQITDQDGNIIAGAAKNVCQYEIVCGNCINNEAPEQVLYLIQGVTGNCNIMNGVETTLTNRILLGYPDASGCDYEGTWATNPRSQNVRFTFRDDGWFAELWYVSPGDPQQRLQRVQFLLADIAQKDCMNVTDKVIPYLDGTDIFGDCDFTNATVTINSVAVAAALGKTMVKKTQCQCPKCKSNNAYTYIVCHRTRKWVIRCLSCKLTQTIRK